MDAYRAYRRDLSTMNTAAVEIASLVAIVIPAAALVGIYLLFFH